MKYYAGSKRSAGGVLSSSKKQKMTVIVRPKGEMKFFDTPINHLATDTVTTYRLNNIPQGTDFNERIGLKIKLHYVEGIIIGSSSQPIRLELYSANDASITPSCGYSQQIDRRLLNQHKTVFLHNGTENNLQGYHLKHNLPYGINCRYNTDVASSLNAGSLVCSLAVPIATAITGYFRVWYTDV